MTNPLRVLLVEDNPGDARLVGEALAEAREASFHLDWARSVEEGCARLQEPGWDALLTDLNLPGSSGIATLHRLQAAARQLPVVVLTGCCLEEELARRAVREGAQDYLFKDSLSPGLLSRALTYAIERKRLENFKEEFLENVSHELRTPLTTASGFLRTILDDEAGRLDDGLRRYMEIAFRNTLQLARMVNDLLEATRAREGKLSVLLRRADLAALAREAVEDARLAAAEKGVALAAEAGPGLPESLADPKRCRQVLTNLLGNALRFTPKGGRIEVRLAVEEGEPGLLRATVADTGPGIAPEALPFLFERFHQGRAAVGPGRTGLGLGLYISRELIRLMGGALEVRSEPGQGSAFSFTLPAFRLESILAPFLAGARPGAALIAAGVLPAGWGCSDAVEEEQMSQAAGVLRALAPPGSLPLPLLGEAGQAGVLFLLAREGDEEARALGDRLRSALEELPALRAERIRPRVSVWPLDLPGEGDGRRAVEAVAARVAEVLRTACSSP